MSKLIGDDVMLCHSSRAYGREQKQNSLPICEYSANVKG